MLHVTIKKYANSKTWHWTVSSIHSAHLDQMYNILHTGKSVRAKNFGFGFYNPRFALIYSEGFSSKKSLYQMHQKFLKQLT